MRHRKPGIEVIACAEVDPESTKKIGQACCALCRISPDGSIDFAGKPYLIPLFRSGFLRDYVISREIDPPSLETILTIEQELDDYPEPDKDYLFPSLRVEGLETRGHDSLRLNLTDTDVFQVYRENVLRALLSIFDQPPLEVDDGSHERFVKPQIELGTLHPNLFYGDDYFPPERANPSNTSGIGVADLVDVINERHYSQQSYIYRTADNPNKIIPESVSLIGVSLLVQTTQTSRNRIDEVTLSRRFNPAALRAVLSDDRNRHDKDEFYPSDEEFLYV